MYNLNQDYIASLQMSAMSTAVVLRLERASESPGGLVQSQTAGAIPRVSDSACRSGVGLKSLRSSPNFR